MSPMFEKKPITKRISVIQNQTDTKKGVSSLFRVEVLVNLEAKQDPTPYHDVQKHEHDQSGEECCHLASI